MDVDALIEAGTCDLGQYQMLRNVFRKVTSPIVGGKSHKMLMQSQ